MSTGLDRRVVGKQIDHVLPFDIGIINQLKDLQRLLQTHVYPSQMLPDRFMPPAIAGTALLSLAGKDRIEEVV
jgi:hypothetical protein